MRSIQYEAAEESSKEDAAGRRRGVKESRKVRGAPEKKKTKVKDVEFICESKKLLQQRHPKQREKWATSRTHSHTEEV